MAQTNSKRYQSEDLSISKIKEIDNFITTNLEKFKSNYFDSLLLIYPNSDYLLGMKIAALCSEKKMEEVRSIFDLLDKITYGTYLLNSKGLYYHWIGDFDKAKKFYLKSYEKDINRTNFWVCSNLAFLFEDLDKFEDAKFWYEKTIEENSDYSEIYLKYSNMLINIHELDKAESLLFKLKKYKLNEKLKLEADIEMCRQNFKKADTLIRRSLAIDKLNIDANITLLEILFQKNEFDEIETIISSLKNIYPDDPDLKYYEGKYLNHLGKLSESKILLETAISMLDHKSRQNYYVELCVVLIKLKEYKNAFDLISNAINKFGHDYILDCHYILLSFLLSKSNTKDLLENFKKYSIEEQNQFYNFLMNEYNIRLK